MSRTRGGWERQPVVLRILVFSDQASDELIFREHVTSYPPKVCPHWILGKAVVTLFTKEGVEISRVSGCVRSPEPPLLSHK